MKKIKGLDKRFEKEINNFLFSVSLLTSAKGVRLKITNKVVEVVYTYGNFENEKESFNIETSAEEGLKCILSLKGAKEPDTYTLFHLNHSLELLKKFFIREIQFILRKKWQEVGFSINVLQFEFDQPEHVLKTAAEFLTLLFEIEVEGIVFLDEEGTFCYARNYQEKSLLKKLANHIKTILLQTHKITFFEVLHKYKVYARLQHPYFLAIFLETTFSPIYFLVISYLTNELFWLLTHLKAQKIEKISYQELIKTLIAAIEAKDVYTYGHSEGVTFSALQIGEALHLSKEELFTLKEAALLHDVGKIGVPDVVLLKPGRLTKSEFEVIKLHPVIGAEILKKAKRLAHLAPIVRAHHEKWNGTGYPDKLAKEEIPFLARIISIADVFDALTHDRIYRKAFSKERALEVLEKESGKSFDPEILKVALPVLEECPIFKPEKEEIIFHQMELIRRNYFYKDPLVGCYNLNAFYAHAKEVKTRVQLVFVSLKEFYYLNLIKGPVETDKIILSLYQKLADIVGEENIYRVGPDEFIVIIFKTWPVEKIQNILKDIEKSLETPLNFEIVETEYSPKNVESILHQFKTKKNYIFLLHNSFLTLKNVCKKVAVFDKNLNLLYKKGLENEEIEKIKKTKKVLTPVKYLYKTIGYFYCDNPCNFS